MRDGEDENDKEITSLDFLFFSSLLRRCMFRGRGGLIYVHIQGGFIHWGIGRKENTSLYFLVILLFSTRLRNC